MLNWNWSMYIYFLMVNDSCRLYRRHQNEFAANYFSLNSNSIEVWPKEEGSCCNVQTGRHCDYTVHPPAESWGTKLAAAARQWSEQGKTSWIHDMSNIKIWHEAKKYQNMALPYHFLETNIWNNFFCLFRTSQWRQIICRLIRFLFAAGLG